MSKFTLAVVAGASAAVGAATTAAIYGLGGSKRQSPPETSASPTATPSPTRTSPLPLTPRDGPHPPLPITPPVDPSGVFQYGFPGPVSDLRSATSLTSAFDRAKRNPHWVAEHITPASLLARNGDRRHSYFAEDPAIPEKFRGKLADYARSG
ncbi:nuclease, partial [Teratosphaeriaceae sp. CCFEE 6253]